DRRLAGAAVADDQLALAAADRDHRVDRLHPGLHRLVHRLARDDAGCLDLDLAALLADDRLAAVDRQADRVDDAAEQLLADRNLDDAAGALDQVALAHRLVLAEQRDADVVLLEVQHHAADLLAAAALELEQLAGHRPREPVDARDAVARGQHAAGLG